MYEQAYQFLLATFPFALQRPFLMSSLCPVFFVPLLTLVEKARPQWFFEKDVTRVKNPFDTPRYHALVFTVLVACNIFDPSSLTFFTLVSPPSTPPPFFQLIVTSIALLFLYEIEVRQIKQY
jgi:hypothetical protein